MVHDINIDTKIIVAIFSPDQFTSLCIPFYTLLGLVFESRGSLVPRGERVVYLHKWLVLRGCVKSPVSKITPK